MTVDIFSYEIDILYISYDVGFAMNLRRYIAACVCFIACMHMFLFEWPIFNTYNKYLKFGNHLMSWYYNRYL